MTAINVLVLPDRILMIADGRAVDQHGRRIHSMSKVTPLPHLNAAVGIRGTRLVGSMVVDALMANARSFDDLRSRIVQIVKTHIFAPCEAVWKAKFGPTVLDAEIVVGGWSENRGPAAFILATSNTNASSGVLAWRAVDIPAAFFSPDDGGALASQFAKADFSDDDAVDLIERQSQLRSDVGDFCQVTTIRKHAIETRILKRWSSAA